LGISSDLLLMGVPQVGVILDAKSRADARIS
jgi:hypothetical protein